MTDALPTTDQPPAGWVPFAIRTGFIAVNGPLYAKKEGETLVLGMRVEERHCNPNNACHGGMLMTFADMFLPIGARYAAKMPAVFLPTINLTMDYLAPAPLGTWIEGRARLLRVTRNLVFADGMITDGDTIIARTNGTFKIGKANSDIGLLDTLFAEG